MSARRLGGRRADRKTLRHFHAEDGGKILTGWVRSPETTAVILQLGGWCKCPVHGLGGFITHPIALGAEISLEDLELRRFLRLPLAPLAINTFGYLFLHLTRMFGLQGRERKAFLARAEKQWIGEFTR